MNNTRVLSVKWLLTIFQLGIVGPAFGHCLVPDESLLEVRCQSIDNELKVWARSFDVEQEPRACPSVIYVEHAELPNYEGWEHSYIGGEPVYRHLNPKALETIIGFGSQNNLTIWRPYAIPGSSVRGYIEFAGGPHWELQCEVMK